MAVPILTIPESAFDPSQYVSARQKNNLITFLLKLVRGSSALLVLMYLVGLFGIKPLMETTVLQKLDFLEKCRGNLRDLYLNIIGKVNYIPIVTVNKNNGCRKLYADAICQTDELVQPTESEETQSTLGMNKVTSKLQSLLDSLNNCKTLLTTDMPHYRVVDYTLKDFRQKTDMLYFNQRNFFSGPTTQNGKKQAQKNMAQEVKTDIRGIKGLYMSGLA